MPVNVVKFCHPTVSVVISLQPNANVVTVNVDIKIGGSVRYSLVLSNMYVKYSRIYEILKFWRGCIVIIIIITITVNLYSAFL